MIKIGNTPPPLTNLTPSATPDGSWRAARLGQDGQATSALAEAGAHGRAEVKKVAEEFESLFLNIVLKAMRDTVPKDSLISGGNAEDIYRSMLDEEYARIMATQRHTGLADTIEAFLLKAAGKDDLAAGSDKLTKTQGIQAYQAQALPGAPKQAKIKDGSPSQPLPPRS